LDARSHRFIAGHARREQEDAGFELSDGALALDTARYQLSPMVRAFGLVVRNSAYGPSCPDAWSNEELTLLVPDGAALRPVLSLPLWAWQRVEGEPCAPSNGGFSDDSARMLVGVEPTSSSGFADLRVIADVERRVETWSDAGLDDSSVSRRRRSVVLRYDGTRYDHGPLRNGFIWSEAEYQAGHGDWNGAGGSCRRGRLSGAGRTPRRGARGPCRRGPRRCHPGAAAHGRGPPALHRHRNRVAAGCGPAARAGQRPHPQPDDPDARCRRRPAAQGLAAAAHLADRGRG